MSRLTTDRALREVLDCLIERIFPHDERSPGAVELGVGGYIEARLNGPLVSDEEAICRGLSLVDGWARRQWDREFAQLTESQQEQAIEAALAGEMNDGFAVDVVMGKVIEMTIEGVFCDPSRDGNKEEAGWQLLKGMRRPPHLLQHPAS